MIFASIRIVSDQPQQLAEFYQRATGIEPRWLSPVFAQFVSGSVVFAISGTEVLALGGTPGIAEGASNRSVFIEFRVDDVDAEYARLRDGIVDSFELEPTMMPWGNRSMLFRDPDGNLVNFFAPISEESVARQPSA